MSGKVLAALLSALVAFMVVACGPVAAPPTVTPAVPGDLPAGVTPVATPTPATAPARGEVILRVGVPLLLQPPDPIKGGGFNAINTGLGETLYKLNSKLEPEPWLAARARQLDEKTWEISLRQGVKFHNGVPLDAAKVKASLDRAIAKSATAKALLDAAQIEAKDAVTLVVVTNKPNLILPAILAEPSTVIVEAAAADALGDAFAEKPVLTGPFKMDRFQQDKEWSVVRHQE